MAARRGRGEGTIFQRNGRWVGEATFGYDERGRRRRRTVYGATKREVQEKLAKLRHQALTGTLGEPTRMTLAQYLDHWLEHAARPAVRPSTFIRYRNLLRTHVTPQLGGVRLAALTPGQVQAVYSRAAQAGAAPKTVQNLHGVLHKALGQAVRWGYVPRNVADAVEKPRNPGRRMQALTPEQAGQLLAAVRGDRLEALYVLALATGMRQGELLGLRWEDVDFTDGAVTVRRTLQEINGELVVGEPKTARGRRRIDLPAFAVEALREHRKRQLAEGHPGTWVFTNLEGGPIRRSNFVGRHFAKTLERAALPRIRFHDLRHTAATLMLARGIHPRVVQERLGHATISITLDTYSHVLPTLQRQAAAELDAMFASLAR